MTRYDPDNDVDDDEDDDSLMEQENHTVVPPRTAVAMELLQRESTPDRVHAASVTHLVRYLMGEVDE